ncbi:MAG: cytochrome C [Rhodobacteraceae bacterium]|nr:cytochrome C [Paracoccaceae bacterium]
MLKALFLSALFAGSALTTAAYADSNGGSDVAAGDAAAGADQFKSCKACHGIVNGDETIVRGGRSGPDLFGVIGSTAGSAEGFRYSDSLVAAGEAGLVWTEELLAEFIMDPTGFLRTNLDDSSARSKMTYKLRSEGNDIAAYLASVSPEVESNY